MPPSEVELVGPFLIGLIWVEPGVSLRASFLGNPRKDAVSWFLHSFLQMYSEMNSPVYWQDDDKFLGSVGCCLASSPLCTSVVVSAVVVQVRNVLIS